MPASPRRKSRCGCRRSLPPPLLRRRQVSKVKADKEEVSADSLDLEKEEEGNISVGTSTGAIYLFSRQGALKLITPLQLLSCRCKRKCPSSLLLRNPLCGSPAHQWRPSAHYHLVARCLDNNRWFAEAANLVIVQLLSFWIFVLAFNIYWSEHCILNKGYEKKVKTINTSYTSNASIKLSHLCLSYFY